MRISIAILVLASVVLNAQMGEASWLIDAGRLHVSAHGQTSCQDCHENISKKDFHPNPLDVTKSGKDFFSVGQCLSCHDSIMDDLEDGSHGSVKVQEPEKYTECISCHDPHYQARIRDKQGVFDPDSPIHKQCGTCHEIRTSLPTLSPEDERCMACHLPMTADDPEDRKGINRLCLHCHGKSGTKAQEITGKSVPLIDEESHKHTPHA